MATKNKDGEPIQEGDDGRAQAAAARAEVVEILAGAVFTLLLEGRLPPPRSAKPEQHRECS